MDVECRIMSHIGRSVEDVGNVSQFSIDAFHSVLGRLEPGARRPLHHPPAPCQPRQGGQVQGHAQTWWEKIYFIFASGGGLPTLPWDFTVLHNDPAAPQDHCGWCRIRTRDLCPRSMVPMSLNILFASVFWSFSWATFLRACLFVNCFSSPLYSVLLPHCHGPVSGGSEWGMSESWPAPPGGRSPALHASGFPSLFKFVFSVLLIQIRINFAAQIHIHLSLIRIRNHFPSRICIPNARLDPGTSSQNLHKFWIKLMRFRLEIMLDPDPVKN